MKALRTLVCLFFAATPALWLEASAQALPGGATVGAVPANPPHGMWLPGARSYLGLTLERSSRFGACSGMALTCAGRDPSAQLYTGAMVGNFWGVELGFGEVARPSTGGAQAGVQGLSLSLVGKAQLAPSLKIFGKAGTAYGRADNASLAVSGNANAERGFGLSFGGGVSFDFTQRLSATLEWESSDLRFAGPSRDPVRSTSLGLKYRY